MTVILTIIVVLLIVAYLVTYIFVSKLLNGELIGTFDGFLGNYILKTFRKTCLYYKGSGLPVTLTNCDICNKKGTVIYLSTPADSEVDRCKFECYNFSPFNINDLKWTKEINRNPNSNEFSRFNSNYDEPLTVPFWIFKIKQPKR